MILPYNLQSNSFITTEVHNFTGQISERNIYHTYLEQSQNILMFITQKIDFSKANNKNSNNASLSKIRIIRT